MKTGLREFVVISHTVAFVPDLLETKTLLIYSSVAMKGESGRDELLGVSGAKKVAIYRILPHQNFLFFIATVIFIYQFFISKIVIFVTFFRYAQFTRSTEGIFSRNFYRQNKISRNKRQLHAIFPSRERYIAVLLRRILSV